MPPVYTAEGRESTKARRVMVLNSEDAKIARLPENYLANTNKEELCLEYVRNFNARFALLHPELDPLFFVARNEYGVEKFVPTGLRPTLLPFTAVYDLADAAAFVANFLHYEPLDPPTRPPACLPSPSQVLEWSCGDSFDYAQLLCSFLLGAGYDAYVVMGKAPREVCLRDLSGIECPLLVDERLQAEQAVSEAKAAAAKALATKPTKYLMPPPPATQSAFDAQAKHGHRHHHHRHHDAEPGDDKDLDPAEWLPSDAKDNGGGDDDDEAKSEHTSEAKGAEARGTEPSKRDGGPASDDPLAGQRLHCWVLVRGGKRDVRGFKFVEPSTGAVCDTDASPYHCVDTMWNHKNLFVNLQASTTPLAETSYDVLDNSKWEFAFVEPSALLAQKQAERELADENGDASPVTMPGTPKTPYSSGSPLTGRSSPRGSRRASSSGSARSPSSAGGNGFDNDAKDDAPATVANAGAVAAAAGPGGDHAHGERNGEHALLVHHDDVENILDLPPSWVGQLRVPRQAMALRYPPTGSRTLSYHRAKLELFADALHPQGCVQRLTIYRDAAHTVAVEVREQFKFRRDLLASRVRKPLADESVEVFLPGRAGGLAMLVASARRRELDFYRAARTDGLVRREEAVGQKVCEFFEARPDRMVYRSATLAEDSSGSAKPSWCLPTGGTAGGGTDLVAQKLAVKFSPESVASGGVAKRSYYLTEARVRVRDHLAAGAVHQRERVYYKEKRPGSTLSAGSNLSAAAQAAADADEARELGREKDVLADVKRAAAEMVELVKARRKEELLPAVDEPIFVAAPKKAALAHAAGGYGSLSGGGLGSLNGLGGEANSAGPPVDYLTPFLAGGPRGAQQLAKDDAQRVRDACLRSLKERLLERANIIQNRLNDENARLSKRQATFQRNASRDGDPAAEAEFEKFCADAMFTIGILEQRLVAHEESALKKYQALDEKLSADSRLAALSAT